MRDLCKKVSVMPYPKYVRVAIEARWFDPEDPLRMRCECPDPLCYESAHDVHHIRGRKWSLLLDPYNLIFLNRTCHNNYTRFTYEEYEAVVKAAIDEGQVLKHKR